MNTSSLVEKGYDQIARIYRTNKNGAVLTSVYFQCLMKELNQMKGADTCVCDLGCASGYPLAGYFASQQAPSVPNQIHYKGFDISEAQIALAREEYGHSSLLSFKQQDMLEAVAQWEDESNAAVVSLYAINHVSRVHHSFLLQHIFRSLSPNGLLLFNVGGNGALEGASEDWLGTSMFWSQFSSEWYRVTMADIGFTLLLEFTDTNIFLGEEEIHTVFLVQKKEHPL